MNAPDDLNPILLAAAQRWQGTPFREHARVCGAGVDCVQLAAALLEEAGFAPACDLPGGYAVDFGEHAEASPLLDWFTARPGWQDVNIPADLQPGDVLLFVVGKVPNHCGVLIGGTRFLHVFRGGVVRFSDLRDDTYLSRLLYAFRHVRRLD